MPYIVIIILYANFFPEQKRKAQLIKILSHINNLVKDNTIKYKNIKLVIAEQVLPKKYFNRGQLANLAVKWVSDNLGNPKYVIIHDVDMLPDKTLFEQYLIEKNMSLIPYDAATVAVYPFKLPIGGGIIKLNYKDYQIINGFPNNFWGWGGEDNAIQQRCERMGIMVDHVTKGSITHIDAQRTTNKDKMSYLKKKKIKNMIKWELLEKDAIDFKENGYRQLNKSDAVIQNIIKKNIIPTYHIKFKLNEYMLKDAVESIQKFE